jgi:hypothetical protein
MNPEEIVKQIEAAYIAHDIDWLAGFWHPDIVAYFNGQKAFEGREALLDFQREQFTSRITNKMKITPRAASGSIIAIEWEATFTDKASGEVRYVYAGAFLTMRENRLIEWHNYSATYSDRVGDEE